MPDIFDRPDAARRRQISYRAVRNHGTIGGSVALADPAADWPGCLIALDASVRMSAATACDGASRRDFHPGLYATTLTAGDIIIGFDIPTPTAPLRWGFAKVARKSGAFAHSIAVATWQGKDGPVRVVLGAGGPRRVASPRPATCRNRQLARSSCAPRSTAISTASIPTGRRLSEADAHAATILRAVREACGPND